MTCPQENTSQSEHSPGIVGDSEILLRLIFSPHHWDEIKNELKPAAFMRSELSGRGFSVERKKYSSSEYLTKKSQTIGRSNSKKIFVGIIRCLCLSVRNIVDDTNQQAFCILDTATIEDRGHADIRFSSDYKRSSQLKLRGKLTECFDSPLLKIDQLYPNKTINLLIDVIRFIKSTSDNIKNLIRDLFMGRGRGGGRGTLD